MLQQNSWGMLYFYLDVRALPSTKMLWTREVWALGLLFLPSFPRYLVLGSVAIATTTTTTTSTWSWDLLLLQLLLLLVLLGPGITMKGNQWQIAAISGLQFSHPMSFSLKSRRSLTTATDPDTRNRGNTWSRLSILGYMISFQIYQVSSSSVRSADVCQDGLFVRKTFFQYHRNGKFSYKNGSKRAKISVFLAKNSCS